MPMGVNWSALTVKCTGNTLLCFFAAANSVAVRLNIPFTPNEIFCCFCLIQGILGTKKATTSPIMGRCSRGATHISSLLLTHTRHCRSLRSLPPYRNQGPNASPKNGLCIIFALILQNQKNTSSSKGRNVSIRLPPQYKTRSAGTDVTRYPVLLTADSRFLLL